MSHAPIKFPGIINEGRTPSYSEILKDKDGTPVPASGMSSLTLTLSNEADGAIINSRNAVNALNANNVTVDESGNIEYVLQPLDTAIQDATQAFETHRATFQCTYNGGAHRENWDVDFLIRNLSKVGV